jgi:deoxycytidylate deaminase
VAQAQDATPVPADTTPPAETPLAESTALPREITGDNSYCLVCHNQPWRSVTFGDGAIQNLYVDPDTIAASVHGADSSGGTFGCIDCHGDDAFPHNNPTPADERAYTLYAVSLCASCHEDQVTELESGLHEEAILAGNHEAAVCTDCHSAHDVRPIVEEPDLIAGVCGDCHQTTLVEWQGSAHVDIEPLGCVTCHSQHTQRLRVGNTPDELCVNCHKPEDVMPIFVHEQHLTDTADVTCLDCHMYRGEHADGQAIPISTGARTTGHSMLMDATPCNTCHEELVDSGEWAALIEDRPTVETPTEVALVPQTEVEAVAEAATEVSYVQLLQGLILGLGFGVTFAAVFIARGNRVRQYTPVEPVPPAEAAPEVPDNRPEGEDQHE